MVIEPQVLLMDEPLSNLDAKLRVEMREEIRDIQKTLGLTTIYVTHDQEEALVISDRIAVMNFGVVQQVGTSWEIYKEPTNTFVASFVGNMNFLDATPLASRNGVAEFEAGGRRIQARAPKTATQALRLAVRPEDLTLCPEAEAVSSTEDFSSIPGRVEKSSFTGSLVRYTVDCGSNVSLTIERYKPENESLILPNGTPVSVKIPLQSVLLFDAETGERL